MCKGDCVPGKFSKKLDLARPIVYVLDIWKSGGYVGGVFWKKIGILINVGIGAVSRALCLAPFLGHIIFKLVKKL